LPQGSFPQYINLSSTTLTHPSPFTVFRLRFCLLEFSRRLVLNILFFNVSPHNKLLLLFHWGSCSSFYLNRLASTFFGPATPFKSPPFLARLVEKGPSLSRSSRAQKDTSFPGDALDKPPEHLVLFPILFPLLMPSSDPPFSKLGPCPPLACFFASLVIPFGHPLPFYDNLSNKSFLFLLVSTLALSHINLSLGFF